LPSESVTAVRDWFVAALVAVTVTPGTTPPDSSSTLPCRSAPVRRAWLNASTGVNSRNTRTVKRLVIRLIACLLFFLL
jgi:hypothetical protein